MSGHALMTRAGRTLALGRLGLGTAPLGNMYRAFSEGEVFDTVEAAWRCGIRYFDTAPLYGHGLAELRLGKALAGRTGFAISTKVGRILEECKPGEEGSGIYVNTPNRRVRFDYSYDGVMRSLEESLKRLAVDRIDILYVHDVDARTHGGRENSETRIIELVEHGGWRALSDLRSAGVVTAIGAGVNEWQPCKRLLELTDPDLFLLAGRYTLLEQEPLHTLFPDCTQRGVGIVIGGVFNSGILAGRPSYDYGSAPPNVIERARAIGEVCASFDVSLPAAALNFCLAHPLAACVLVGCQSAQEVRANAAHGQAEISGDLWDALKGRGLIDSAAPVPSDDTPPTGSRS